MAADRYFYITQENLVVWRRRRGSFCEQLSFTQDEAGVHAFSNYLHSDPHSSSAVLVDVIEEEFSVDAIPKLPLRDRQALIERRLSRKYSRTRFRLGHYQGASEAEEGMRDVLYSAVSNHELLEPWLAVIAEQQTPLSGIYSVPLLGEKMLRTLRKPAGNSLLLSHHQGNRLRMVYLRDGDLKSARLSKAPPTTDDGYGEHVFSEILRSRRYLERARLIENSAAVDAYMITDAENADRIISGDSGKLPLHFHFIRTAEAAKALRLSEVPGPDRLEILYLALVARGRPDHNYAVQGETRYHKLSVARHAALGGIVAASLVGSAFAGVNFMTAFELRSATALMDSQIQRMEETFRRENDDFAPVKADSHEMKQAVDTGDYLLANRLPAAWVMEQLGAVLGEYPQLQLDELTWTAEAEPESTPQPRRGENVAVNVKPLQTVSAEVVGQVVPFDGNLRNAFALIKEFENRLREKTAFDEVRVTEYPIDASPQSSVSGEFVASDDRGEAHFKVLLRLNVPLAGSDNEAI